MMWYCAERYCSLLLNPPLRSITPENQGTLEEVEKEEGALENDNATHIKKENPNDLDIKDEAKDSPDVKEIKPKVPKKIFLTPFEIEGLDILINWLENLPSNKRHVPSEVRNASQLLKKLKVKMFLFLVLFLKFFFFPLRNLLINIETILQN